MTKKRQAYTIDFKKKILDDLKKHSQIFVSNKHSIATSTINDFKKNEEKIIKKYNDLLINGNKSIKRILDDEDKNFNDKLFNKLTNFRKENIPVSGLMIKETALKMKTEDGKIEFKASDGWIRNFKKRYNIKNQALSGTKAQVNPSDLIEFERKLEEKKLTYAPNTIYNIDETALFYKKLPIRSHIFSDEDTKKRPIDCKERITVLLGCNVFGKKLKPLFIGKSKRPRCFKNLELSEQNFFYRSNSNAWMTREIFTEYLKSINYEFYKKNEKIILILDNARCHINLNLSNVEMLFLPPNSTSIKQPLDLGIIWSFKSFYNKNLIRNLIEKESFSVRDIKNISVLDGLFGAVNAWKNVTDATITNCFIKSDILTSTEILTQNLNSTIHDEDDELKDNLDELKTFNYDCISVEALIKNTIQDDITICKNEFLDSVDMELIQNIKLDDITFVKITLRILWLELSMMRKLLRNLLHERNI